MPQPPKNLRHFSSLVEVVTALRGPEGCPWDKEQTHQTLTRYAIEEAAELSEALDSGDPEAIREELGDVLLQVVLNAEIARQTGTFNIEDVIETLNRKMIHRHPHVFATTKVDGAAQVVSNWHQLKAQEKKDKPLSGGLPAALPALLASQKIGEKTKAYRFDWARLEDVVAKVEEELAELKDALTHQDKGAQMRELGDLLFSLAQLARHMGGDSEQALRQTNLRFEKRFLKMFELLKTSGLDPAKASAEQLERHWQLAKQNEAKD
ncbi:MAG: nucleoside triphosphate pyrophosphohydrolase [Bdellovibrionales bacterium]